ncbi:MAG: hypothetical protein JWQ43_899 [Glaciihabitans sp.]|nr:hypothetical protein [Glaciihabitans sp.]
MSRADNGLTVEDETAIREAVAEAVIGIPEGLRGGLESNPADYLRLVSASRTAAETSSRLLRESIGGARAAGHSWDTLGKLLGVSRQAAQQRFGPAPVPSDAQYNKPPYDRSTHDLAQHDGSELDLAQTAPRRVISPLTAFDEMAVLADEGRRGWHSVDYGTLYHLVEKSDWQWEHRRVIWSPITNYQRLEADGWMLVGVATFPWAYWSRQLETPAEPE